LNSGGKLKGEMASSMVVSSIGTIIHYKRAADAGMPRPDITSNPSLHLRVALKGAARLDLRLDADRAYCAQLRGCIAAEVRSESGLLRMRAVAGRRGRAGSRYDAKMSAELTPTTDRHGACP
jgi:hypothetical protein